MGRARGFQTDHSPARRSAAALSGDALRALFAFEASEPNLVIWKRYPHVSEEQDELTDEWACDSVSRQLAEFLRDRGVDAVVVNGQDAEHPMHLEHYWVRVRDAAGDIDIDYTARQFYSLEKPGVPEHQDLPCPLVWPADGSHPVSGRYGQLHIISEASA